jgi:hypothetical protein
MQDGRALFMNAAVTASDDRALIQRNGAAKWKQ